MIAMIFLHHQTLFSGKTLLNIINKNISFLILSLKLDTEVKNSEVEINKGAISC